MHAYSGSKADNIVGNSRTMLLLKTDLVAACAKVITRVRAAEAPRNQNTTPAHVAPVMQPHSLGPFYPMERACSALSLELSGELANLLQPPLPLSLKSCSRAATLSTTPTCTAKPEQNVLVMVEPGSLTISHWLCAIWSTGPAHQGRQSR